MLLNALMFQSILLTIKELSELRISLRFLFLMFLNALMFQSIILTIKKLSELRISLRFFS